MMLTAEDLRAFCLSQKAAVEEFPFGPDARVFKMMGKMFALMGVGADPPTINLKCDPLLALALRETYEAVQPGYHMDKRHWITVTVDGSIPDNEVIEWIEGSYDLVIKGLKKADREKLAAMK